MYRWTIVGRDASKLVHEDYFEENRAAIEAEVLDGGFAGKENRTSHPLVQAMEKYGAQLAESISRHDEALADIQGKLPKHARRMSFKSMPVNTMRFGTASLRQRVLRLEDAIITISVESHRVAIISLKERKALVEAWIDSVNGIQSFAAIDAPNFQRAQDLILLSPAGVIAASETQARLQVRRDEVMIDLQDARQKLNAAERRLQALIAIQPVQDYAINLSKTMVQELGKSFQFNLEQSFVEALQHSGKYPWMYTSPALDRAQDLFEQIIVNPTTSEGRVIRRTCALLGEQKCADLCHHILRFVDAFGEGFAHQYGIPGNRVPVLRRLTQRVLYPRLWSRLKSHPGAMSKCHEMDTEYASKISLWKDVEPGHIGIPERYCPPRDVVSVEENGMHSLMFSESISLFAKLNTLLVPLELRECLALASGLLHNTAVHYSSLNRSACTCEEDEAALGGDQFFSLMLYAVSRAGLSRPHQVVYTVSTYSTQDQLCSDFGYYLSCLEGILAYIRAAAPLTVDSFTLRCA